MPLSLFFIIITQNLPRCKYTEASLPFYSIVFKTSSNNTKGKNKSINKTIFSPSSFCVFSIIALMYDKKDNQKNNCPLKRAVVFLVEKRNEFIFYFFQIGLVPLQRAGKHFLFVFDTNRNENGIRQEENQRQKRS